MTLRNLKPKLELGLNVLVAASILIIAVVVVKRTFFPPQSNQLNSQQQVQQLLGTRVGVPGTPLNKKTLIFFLKKDCVFCQSIAPSYRELISEARKRDIDLIAILPNPLDEGRAYVRSLGLEIENVQSGSLASYKIPGTPSVLFVDGEAIVRSAWFGAEPTREREMREKLVALF